MTSARTPLREVQRSFYQNVLLPNLKRSSFSHGGVPGRSALTNAAAHAGQPFVYSTDISRFFPSVHYERVRNLFVRLGCSAKVAGLCTRLTTHDSRLPQGFSTSPILADAILSPVDAEIAAACDQLGLVYTRFVDDITITGPFDLRRSNIPDMVRRIVRCRGFRINTAKEQLGASLTDGEGTVTNIRVLDDRLDVPTGYYRELIRRLQDHAKLAAGTSFTGPYCTQEQLWGKVEYVCSLNPNRRAYLYKLLGRIDWNAVQKAADKIGLIIPVRVIKTKVNAGTKRQ